MIRDFLIPLGTLLVCAVASIAGLDRLCVFHQTYMSISAKLESERWLVKQCLDPQFFSNMHQHSDLCFQVENNARVGAFMLSLRQLTQSFLSPELLSALSVSRFASWPFLCGLAALLLLGPSWLVSSSRTRRWPACVEGHYKNA